MELGPISIKLGWDSWIDIFRQMGGKEYENARKGQIVISPILPGFCYIV